MSNDGKDYYKLNDFIIGKTINIMDRRYVYLCTQNCVIYIFKKNK